MKAAIAWIALAALIGLCAAALALSLTTPGTGPAIGPTTPAFTLPDVQHYRDWVPMLAAGVSLSIALALAALALVIATRARRAADHATGLALELAGHANRAYLSVVDCRIDRLFAEPLLTATARLTNGGATPARRVRIRSALALVGDADARPFPPLEREGRYEIAPGGSFALAHDLRLDEASLAKLRAGERHLIFFGEVRFVDAFDMARTMAFRLIASGDALAREPVVFVPSPTGNHSD